MGSMSILETWFGGVVGYHVCLTLCAHRRSPVRARVEPSFFAFYPELADGRLFCYAGWNLRTCLDDQGRRNRLTRNQDAHVIPLYQVSIVKAFAFTRMESRLPEMGSINRE